MYIISTRCVKYSTSSAKLSRAMRNARIVNALQSAAKKSVDMQARAQERVAIAPYARKIALALAIPAAIKHAHISKYTLSATAKKRYIPRLSLSDIIVPLCNLTIRAKIAGASARGCIGKNCYYVAHYDDCFQAAALAYIEHAHKLGCIAIIDAISALCNRTRGSEVVRDVMRTLGRIEYSETRHAHAPLESVKGAKESVELWRESYSDMARACVEYVKTHDMRKGVVSSARVAHAIMFGSAMQFVSPVAATKGSFKRARAMAYKLLAQAALELYGLHI